MHPIPEDLSRLICTTIIGALDSKHDPVAQAEKAAEAYAAGLAAFRKAVKPAATPQPE